MVAYSTKRVWASSMAVDPSERPRESDPNAEWNPSEPATRRQNVDRHTFDRLLATGAEPSDRIALGTTPWRIAFIARSVRHPEAIRRDKRTPVKRT